MKPKKVMLQQRNATQIEQTFKTGAGDYIKIHINCAYILHKWYKSKLTVLPLSTYLFSVLFVGWNDGKLTGAIKLIKMLVQSPFCTQCNRMANKNPFLFDSSEWRPKKKNLFRFICPFSLCVSHSHAITKHSKIHYFSSHSKFYIRPNNFKYLCRWFSPYFVRYFV